MTPSHSTFSYNIKYIQYKGPKGVKIGCILDDEEAKFGLKLQTDVAITTPKYVGKCKYTKDYSYSNIVQCINLSYTAIYSVYSIPLYHVTFLTVYFSF